MRNRIFALLLVAALAITAACATGAPDTPATPAAPPVAAGAPTAGGAVTDVAPDEPPTPLTVFFGTTTLADRNDNPTIREIERLTNTLITAIEAPAGQSAEQLAVLIAGGQTPDMIWAASALLNRYGAEGVFIDFNDHLDRMPSANAVLTDSMLDMMRAYDGSLWQLIKMDEQGAGAIFVRGDWMTRYGLESPTTLEDFYDLAYWFTHNTGVDYGLAFNDPHIASGLWGLPQNHWIEENGEFIYANAHPDMRYAWEFAHRLYSSGLIDPEFTTLTFAQVQERVINEQYAMWWARSSHNLIVSTNLRQMHPDAYMIVMDTPIAPGVTRRPIWEARPIYPGNNKILHPQGTAISARSPHIDAALRVIDWTHTEEGEHISRFGVEGVTFNYVEVDGMRRPLFVDELHGPENSEARQRMGTWQIYHFGGGVHTIGDWENAQVWDDLTARNIDRTLENAFIIQVHTATPTGELVKPEIDRAFAEHQTRAILGAVDIDTAWNAWLAEFERLGGLEWTTETNAFMNR